MERIPTFQQDWLDTRFAFDASARSSDLEKEFLQELSQTAYPQIVDLGAGIGANCRYFLDKIPGNPRWILIEKDPLLSNQSCDYLAVKGKLAGYMAIIEKDTLILTKGKREVHITFIAGDMLALPQLLSIDTVDAIIANAVFDLFSLQQFEQLLSFFVDKSPLFLSTLNYIGMAYTPSTRESKKVIGWYEQHMEQEQRFGQRMGKDAPELMIGSLKQHGYSTQVGDSNWEIGETDIKMKSYLLSFMKEAIPELPLGKEELGYFYKWEKEEQERTSSLVVYHRDILAWK